MKDVDGRVRNTNGTLTAREQRITRQKAKNEQRRTALVEKPEEKGFGPDAGEVSDYRDD